MSYSRRRAGGGSRRFLLGGDDDDDDCRSDDDDSRAGFGSRAEAAAAAQDEIQVETDDYDRETGETSGPCGDEWIEGDEHEDVLVEEDEEGTRRATGHMDTLSQEYESLDYEINFNGLLMDQIRMTGWTSVVTKDAFRWVVVVLIGFLTALVACIIDITIDILAKLKYELLGYWTDRCVEENQNCLWFPLLQWVMLNVVPVSIGAALVSYLAPVAAGSGIPHVKCYLNGVKVPKLVRIKTLVCKALGVILSVVGGLAVGKEGPMIHSGAVIAAGISQGKSTSLNIDTSLLSYFRQDHEKRDFVSGGAAAGVAAAFGAPVGGVLFSLEEGASFWNQALTWRIFFGSMTSYFTLNMILSIYKEIPGQLSNGGLLNFGMFDNTTYVGYELPIFVLIGVIGGLLGALYNHINHKLTVFRLRYVTKPWQKVLEASTVAAVTATIGFLMIYLISDCRPIGKDPTDNPIQMYCDDGQYSAVGALWFQTPEQSVRSLLHDPNGSHQPTTLACFFVVYFLLNCWTYGLSISAGVFIPTLLTGAAWGRLLGALIEMYIPNNDLEDTGKYALLGAAAMLGGVVRMTISLTVILIEATGNLTYGFPIMVVLMVAKWVGDYFNEGLYDVHIRLSGVPLLGWEPPPLSAITYASEVMACPVVTLKTSQTVGEIVDVLEKTNHNGFPVTEVTPPNSPGTSMAPSGQRGAHDENVLKDSGVLRGFILRSELIVMLQHKIFSELFSLWEGKLDAKLFTKAYPRYPDVQQIHVSHEERSMRLDLSLVMNQTPSVVRSCTPLPQIFRQFRALGLRHMVVLNDRGSVVGIITRKDLARYSVTNHGFTMIRKTLHVVRPASPQQQQQQQQE